MRRLISLQVIALWTISASVFAADLRSELQQLSEGLSAQNCVANMSRASTLLDKLNIDEYQDEIKSQGHELLLKDLFKYKLMVHEKFRELYQGQELERDCGDAVRGALRSIRTVEDYVTANFYHLYKEEMSFPDNAFQVGNPHVARNPLYKDFDLSRDLRSGDIILTRGNAYTSAAISSLGEFDTQFSHMSVVYKDPQGKFWTVEAHIEVGSFVRPLEDHIDDKNGRTMIFRFDDPEISARAAEYIFNKVKKASDTTGNIRYDFGFDQDDNEELFCSEVVSYAYSVASDNKVGLPFYRSRLMHRKPEFVKQLEITAQESFIPADIEVDPRFTIIAEWRDAQKIRANLQRDAIIHAMFAWSDDYGYRLIQGSSSKSLIYRNVAWPLRRVPFLKKYFKDKMPINMSRKLIGYFGVLESIGELLHKELALQDDESVSVRGLPLVKSEMREVLEEFRQNDLGKKKKKLHKMFRPVTK